MGEDIGKLAIPVKKRMRFREKDDIAFLREVAGQNPFSNSGVWDVIREHVFLLTTKNFSVKSLKDHLDSIIKLWLDKTKTMEYKSGTEEDYTEKEQLCQDIYEYMNQFRMKQKRKNTKKIQMENGKKTRDEWAHNFHNNNVIEAAPVTDHEYCTNVLTPELDDSANIEPESESIIDLNKSLPVESTQLNPPYKITKKKINVQRQGLSYLEQYDQRQLETKKQDQILEGRRIGIEEKKIALEERKMELAEKKFNLEEYDRKKNLELFEGRLADDIEQRKVMANLIERQEKIIGMLSSNKK
ncbi:hypothetical protein JTB14_004108 [Gonioctena quinquepunctata]|nr:hypothetical protein JTB14_004108 [Gonioctena quinquepunctata]